MARFNQAKKTLLKIHLTTRTKKTKHKISLEYSPTSQCHHQVTLRVFFRALAWIECKEPRDLQAVSRTDLFLILLDGA
jgi:hypothetical protein